MEKDDSILFYHRNQEEWVTPSWKVDLESQQVLSLLLFLSLPLSLSLSLFSLYSLFPLLFYLSHSEHSFSYAQMPLDLPAVLVNQTFGGLLTGSDDSKLARTGPMQLTSVAASATQSLSVAGNSQQPPSWLNTLQ